MTQMFVFEADGHMFSPPNRKHHVGEGHSDDIIVCTKSFFNSIGLLESDTIPQNNGLANWMSVKCI